MHNQNALHLKRSPSWWFRQLHSTEKSKKYTFLLNNQRNRKQKCELHISIYNPRTIAW